MTKYEKTSMIGMRTQQLNNNAMTTLTDEELKGLTSIRDIAMKEFELKKIPLMIERNVNGNKEYWKVEDMIINF
jgi:DNA-directed RNA polymerase subunit K/omega